MDCTLESTKCTLDKNETSRFLGDGVSFKAKLIGILEVSEARGDRMCQEALSDLKMAIRAAGEHKQRITINIAIDGLRLRDEKTGDSLYHHPVHKISFIAQDMTDSRAFGYIFGSPDTGHRFFGIKTDKAASQVVIAMRDLFQVVFALKKKEIELAKQHLSKDRHGNSSFFSESSISNSKFLKNTNAESSKSSYADSKTGASGSETRQSPAVADLVDLELELNSLQQGLTQMERITPSDPFGSKDDPFGDSFINIPPNPLLPPPPPSGRDRASRTASDSGCIFSPKIPHIITIGGGSSSLDSGNAALSSTSDNLFHSKPDQLTNKEFAFPEFNSSHEDPSSSGGWFTPPADATSAASPSPTAAINTGPDQTVDQHELTKQEIMSQFDVFTELDPLEKKNQNDINEFQSTGKSKPYIDKKHFFRELKNPPKKALNDLVPTSDSPLSSLFPSSFQHSPTASNSVLNMERPRSGPSELLTCTMNANAMNTSGTSLGTAVTSATAITSGVTSHSSSGFTVDPFGEDPFDQSDPFAEADFSKQDPFENEFEFKLGGGLARSPINTEGIKIIGRQFDKESKLHSFRKLHENPSLDLSSESEAAPEPPPRPQPTTLGYIKPPPLPPKKQAGSGDLLIKPPPRPPHTITADISHYDYIEAYETGKSPSALEGYRKKTDETTAPPLPAPARKIDVTNDVSKTPETLKPMSIVSEEEEYLTPISMPTNTKKRYNRVTRNAGPVLLPPPQNPKKQHLESVPVTIASILDNKPNITYTRNTSTTLTMDSLDITLSQLTLSGLNELATKLNIPASQLSNMTLVQLTSYLSNFIKNGSCTETTPSATTMDGSSFQADFAANFKDIKPVSNDNSYDRYAVFRELLEDEIKHTKIIDSESQDIFNEEPKMENSFEDTFEPNNFSNKFVVDFPGESTFTTNFSNNISANIRESTSEVVDKYAALRDIVNSDLEICIINESNDNIAVENEENEDINADVLDDVDGDVCKPDLVTAATVADTNILNETELARFKGKSGEIIEFKAEDGEVKDSIEIKKEINLITPEKSPVGIMKTIKSPVPIAITDLVQSNTRLTSGSLSDVVSGSSPEVDNTGSTSEALKKNSNTAGESWAIFEQPNNNNNHQHLLHSESLVKDADKNVVSEEGVSPWSSDSKEYGNGSPPEWRQRLDSESGGDRRSGQMGDSRGDSRGGRSKGGRDDGIWWEGDGHNDKGPYYPAIRRSTDSYDEDTYNNDHRYPPPPPLPSNTTQRRYQRGHRPPATSVSSTGGGAPAAPAQQQSSSSRDASPWEEELDTAPRRRWPSGSSGGSGRVHSGGGRSYDRHGSGRRPVLREPPDMEGGDSWDEEDDYEYEEEHAISSRFHYPPSDRPRDMEGRGHGGRDPLEWGDDRVEEGRSKPHRRSKRDMERDSRDGREIRDGRDGREQRWCCPDWDQIAIDKASRYASTATTARYPDTRRKHDDRYYSTREAAQHESPWEDEYNNGDEPQPHYVTATRRNWKRPSSATEMDRKTADGRRGERDRGSGDRDRDGRGSGTQYYISTGGSDGERDRRYKNNRRSKSRDSQYSEPIHSRHKTELNTMSMRRTKPHHHSSKAPASQFESDFMSEVSKKGSEGSSKDGGKGMPGRKKSKESPKSDEMNTFPRKSTRSQASMFENDFVLSESESPITSQQRFHFDAEFETSEADSPTIRPSKPSSSRSNYYSGDPKSIKSLSSSSGNQFEPSMEFSRRQRNQLKKDVKLKSNLLKDSNGSSGKSTFRGASSPGLTHKQQKSLFEDDFSPTSDRKDDEPQGISSIQEEYSMEDDDSFATNDFNRTESTRSKRLSQRFNNNIRADGDNNIKKSESVNIFAREDDPFDDDFFSVQEQQEKS